MDAQNNIGHIKHFNFKIITGILLAAFISLVFLLLIGFAKLNYADKIFYSRFIFWGEVGLLYWYAYKVEYQPFFIWGEEPYDLKFIFNSTLVLILSYFASSLIAAIPTLLGWHESNDAMKKVAIALKGQTALIVFTAFTAAVTEELIMRVYVLTRLSQLINNKYVAIVLSAIIFSALHYGYHSIREYIFTFLIGIIFGYYYRQYRSVAPLIIVHFLIDITGLAIATHAVK